MSSCRAAETIFVALPLLDICAYNTTSKSSLSTALCQMCILPIQLQAQFRIPTAACCTVACIYVKVQSIYDRYWSLTLKYKQDQNHDHRLQFKVTPPLTPLVPLGTDYSLLVSLNILLPARIFVHLWTSIQWCPFRLLLEQSHGFNVLE